MSESLEIALTADQILEAIENFCVQKDLIRPPYEIEIQVLHKIPDDSGCAPDMRAIIAVEGIEESNIITDHIAGPRVIDLTPKLPDAQNKIDEGALELASLRLDRAHGVIGDVLRKTRAAFLAMAGPLERSTIQPEPVRLGTAAITLLEGEMENAQQVNPPDDGRN